MGERLSIEELKDRYDEDWLALTEIEKNAEGEIVSGVVVAHSPDRDVVYDAMLKSEATHMATMCFKSIPKGWTFAL